MASKVCYKCREEKTLPHFIGVNSPFFSGSTPVCKECLNKMIAAASEDERWNVVNKICQWVDVPFLPEEWEKFYVSNGKDALGMYIAVFRNEEYKSLDWSMYNETFLRLEEEGRVEEALPEIREKKLSEWRKKWGIDYDEQQLEYLENLHQGLVTSQNIVGALNEDQALKLCKISLVIDEKIRAGVDFSKDLKAYEGLATLSNLTPKNVKDANEFDSFGEVFAYLEKTGWVNQYYDGAVRDEVDNTERNIKNWVRYLYVNETGIAEEIEQRINNLKIAAELEGNDFDEKEFRDYLNGEQQDIKEDFKIDI